MKVKKILKIICFCVICISLLAGCGAEGAENQLKSSEEVEEESSGGYIFESNGVEIKVDEEVSGIVEQLGEPEKYYEEPSCAAQGIAKIYTYPGFRMETYPDGDKDLVACVILKDDSVATPEGVDLSMGKDDIVAVYGSDYAESENSMVYEKRGTKLSFILDGDDIVSIEYDSPVLN